jgi:hypothetical protein
MNDYTATTNESKTDFRLEQYSKETLISLLKLYSKLYIALDGFWYLSMKNEFGNDKSLEHDILVWNKMCKREVDGITKTLNIQKRDIPSFLRVLFTTPWFLQMKYGIEMKNANYGILTIHHCPTLMALEKEGEGREETICKVFDVPYSWKFGKHFNPDLEISPMKLPPRESRDNICCQWEVKLQYGERDAVD